MSSNAGGSATNSGIDYQQRVAALAITHALTGLGFLDDFGLNEEAEIREIYFESENPIDDIALTTDMGNIFIQAKRSINLSARLDSEFSGVVKQFITQYIKNNNAIHKYVLAVSPSASSKIIRDLRKLTESARLNRAPSDPNPLSKSEESALDTIKDVAKSHFLKQSGKELDEKRFLEFFSRVYIAVLDIEKGGTLERAVLTLLSKESAVPPAILWDALISLGLTLSKNRQSIDKHALEEKIGRYLVSSEPPHKESREGDLFNIEANGEFLSGREVILIDSFMDEYDYLLMEFIRFEDDGTKRVKFENGAVTLLNGETYNVLSRASTYAGVERFIEQHKDELQDKSICILPANVDESIEEQPFPIAHRKLCQEILSQHGGEIVCIHCCESISEDLLPVVEIDEEGKKHDVGYAHESCLKPTDRVLGRLSSELFREYPWLKDFDYSGWFRSVIQGQGLFRGLPAGYTDIYPIAWKPDHNPYGKGKWCIKFNLEDGSTRYAHERGRVKRMSHESAIEWAEQFNRHFEEAKKNNNPWCYSANGDTYSQYSTLVKMLPDGEKCVLCESAEPEQINRSIEDAYSQVKYFYAPLLLFLDRESGLPIVNGNAIFLLSNPLNIENILDNWKKVGIEYEDYSTSIIYTDEEFDKFVSEVKADGLVVLVDPVLNLNGELSKGLVIENFYELTARDHTP